VADGLTNRQIAAKLVISERTAECHILNKLGCNSRTQIASWTTPVAAAVIRARSSRPLPYALRRHRRRGVNSELSNRYEIRRQIRRARHAEELEGASVIVRE
jgi:FixJ family two-component response regulator